MASRLSFYRWQLQYFGWYYLVDNLRLNLSCTVNLKTTSKSRPTNNKKRRARIRNEIPVSNRPPGIGTFNCAKSILCQYFCGDCLVHYIDTVLILRLRDCTQTPTTPCLVPNTVGFRLNRSVRYSLKYLRNQFLIMYSYQIKIYSELISNRFFLNT